LNADCLKSGTEKILLVDDKEVIASMEQMMLERLGYHITTRMSSIDALEAFRANPDFFDLVITDMTMPNMTGGRLAKELNLIKPGIPIILCTGFCARIEEQIVKASGIRGISRSKDNIRWPNKYFQDLGYFSLFDAHRAFLQSS
jgi:CheY-like chemotaxis protein